MNRMRIKAFVGVLLVAMLLSTVVISRTSNVKEGDVVEAARMHALQDFHEVFWREIYEQAHSPAGLERFLNIMISLQFPWQWNVPEHRQEYMDSLEEAEHKVLYSKTYVAELQRVSTEFAIAEREMRLEAEHESRNVLTIVGVVVGIVLALGLGTLLYFILS